MARNEEKALTLFSKWQTFKKEFHSVAQNRKPLVSTECQSVTEAEKQRRNAVRQIVSKIASIQNASLGEHRIRELNDEINKFMRQKNYWEKKIRELGGSDYHHMKNKFLDVDGLELPGAPNYKYYGAAKNLPGVRELFAEIEENAEKKRLQRSRGDRKREFNSEYYGFNDEDSGSHDQENGDVDNNNNETQILQKEKEREMELIQQSVEEHKRKKMKLIEEMRRNESSSAETSEELNNYLLSEKESLEYDIAMGSLVGIALPSQEEIMKLVLEEKKKNLLEQFVF